MTVFFPLDTARLRLQGKKRNTWVYFSAEVSFVNVLKYVTAFLSVSVQLMTSGKPNLLQPFCQRSSRRRVCKLFHMLTLCCVIIFLISGWKHYLFCNSLSRLAPYRGWFPVICSLCCSNFVYFYCFHSLKATWLQGQRSTPGRDLIIGIAAGLLILIVSVVHILCNQFLNRNVVRMCCLCYPYTCGKAQFPFLLHSFFFPFWVTFFSSFEKTVFAAYLYRSLYFL